MRMWAQVSFVLSQSTRLRDVQTDIWTERPWKYRALHYMQSHGKNCIVLPTIERGALRIY